MSVWLLGSISLSVFSFRTESRCKSEFFILFSKNNFTVMVDNMSASSQDFLLSCKYFSPSGLFLQFILPQGMDMWLHEQPSSFETEVQIRCGFHIFKIKQIYFLPVSKLINLSLPREVYPMPKRYL